MKNYVFPSLNPLRKNFRTLHSFNGFYNLKPLLILLYLYEGDLKALLVIFIRCHFMIIRNTNLQTCVQVYMSTSLRPADVLRSIMHNLYTFSWSVLGWKWWLAVSKLWLNMNNGDQQERWLQYGHCGKFYFSRGSKVAIDFN